MRTQRRSIFPLENLIVFYPRRLLEIVYDHVALLTMFWKLGKFRNRVKRSPDRHTYTDLSLTPVTGEEADDLDLLTTFAPRSAKVRSKSSRTTAVS